MYSTDENGFHLLSKMRLNEKKVAAILRQQGYKLTTQRRAVLKAIARSRSHLSPAEIYKKAKQEDPKIGLVTVYRTLEILSRLGVICEMRTRGNARSYLIRGTVEHHHHLICTDCGTVVDFTGCDLSRLEKRLSRETGFKMKGHLLELSGHCPSCQKTAPA